MSDELEAARNPGRRRDDPRGIWRLRANRRLTAWTLSAIASCATIAAGWIGVERHEALQTVQTTAKRVAVLEEKTKAIEARMDREDSADAQQRAELRGEVLELRQDIKALRTDLNRWFSRR